MDKKKLWTRRTGPSYAVRPLTVNGDFMKPMTSKKGLKPLPAFNSDGEERDFWGNEDSTEYVDWAKAKRVAFPNLKPSVRTISVRLPVMMIARLKMLAHQRDVPYQSLLKIFLAERLERENRKR
jgi:predicted DNA binding CopG/RHH family protein